MNIQEVKKRYTEAYIEDFGDFEIVHIDKKELDWLIQQAEAYEKTFNDVVLKFGRLTALYIKAVEGDRDFTDFYNHMAEIVYPNGRVNEL
jgi:hypothetical protein